MKRPMRRSRQELSIDESKRILAEGKYAVWGVSGDDNYPYTVPVNYVYDGKSVYIHCARQGHKLDSIRRNPKCSLCIVDKDDVIPEKFTTCFRSVIAFGKASIINDSDEIVTALRMLSHKYSPGIDPADEIKKFLNAVCIVRIDLEAITGKEAIELLK